MNAEQGTLAGALAHFPFQKVKGSFPVIRDFQSIGIGGAKSRMHRIKAHLERQTHWLLGLLIHFKQCLFVIKIYFSGQGNKALYA